MPERSTDIGLQYAWINDAQYAPTDAVSMSVMHTNLYRHIASAGRGRPEVPSHGDSCKPKPHCRGMAEHHGGTKTEPATVPRFQEGHEATAR